VGHCSDEEVLDLLDVLLSPFPSLSFSLRVCSRLLERNTILTFATRTQLAYARRQLISNDAQRLPIA